MNDSKVVLNEYYSAASHLEIVAVHLKSYKKIVGYDKSLLQKKPEILEAAERAHDLEVYIQSRELKLQEIEIDGIPKPVYFNIPDSLGVPGSCPFSRLPNILREAIEAITEHVQAHIGLAAHAVLSAATHIAQTRVDAISSVLGKMPCSLFLLSLGDSGSRKSTCQRVAFKIINERESTAREEYAKRQSERVRGAKSGTDTELFDFDPQETMSDVVFEGLASHMIRGCPFLTVSSDDAGQWFGGHSLTSTTRAATSAGYIIAFDRGRIERNRSLGNANGSGLAENIRLSVSLMAQESVVRKSLLDPLFRSQGLLPRFLLFVSDNIAGTRFFDRETPFSYKMKDPRLLRFWERCEERISMPIRFIPGTRGVDPTLCSLDPEAETIYADFYDYVETLQKPGGDFEHMTGFASRSAELSLRLATVIAFFEQKNSVDSASMRAAADVALHSINGWSAYFVNNENPASDASLAFDLLRNLTTKGMRCFDRRKVQQFGPSYVRRSVSTVNRLLAILEEHQFVFSPDATGGSEYLVNPHYLREKGFG